MLRAVGRAVNRAIEPLGYKIVRPLEKQRPDISPEIQSIWERVRPFTLTDQEAVVALCDAVGHVVRHQIPGAFVECGVFRGGSTMAAALMFKQLGDMRYVHLFDTFEGQPDAEPIDREAATGKPASQLLAEHQAIHGTTFTIAGLEEVTTNMRSTGYDLDRLHFHKGMIEHTLPAQAPAVISVLRLDTDWYASTKHELEHLWPRLSPGGFCIIDDYGHFTGARQAVDEYFAGQDIFLHRLNYTARLTRKSL